MISLEERRMSFTQDIFYDSSLTLYVHVQYKYEIIVKIVLVNMPSVLTLSHNAHVERFSACVSL